MSTDLNVAQGKYADARAKLSASKENVNNIKAKLSKAKNIWQGKAQKNGSADKSDVNKLNDQLNSAQSEYNLADMWDTHTNMSLFNTQLKSMT